MNRSALLVAATAATALTLTACTSGSTEESAAESSAASGALETAQTSEAALTVATAFYPLQFVAEHVGGDLVSLVSLTPAGVEAHDVELSPATVRQLGSADLALYLADFQPAVDDAIATTGVDALDAAEVVALHEAAGHDDEHADDDHDHADDDHADEGGDDNHDHGSTDPHFWLDPHLLAEYGEAVAEAFGEADPAHADTYTANAEALHETLEGLEESFSTGLAQCERDTIIVSHEAFGYLTGAFGLQQEGVAGLDPENEPSPARVLEIKEIIEESGATTVFTESLVSASVAESLAADAGVATAVLDPVENVTEGDDYIAVMTRNLEALQTALGCA